MLWGSSKLLLYVVGEKFFRLFSKNVLTREYLRGILKSQRTKEPRQQNRQGKVTKTHGVVARSKQTGRLATSTAH